MSDPNLPPASPDPLPPRADYASPATPGETGLFAKPFAPGQIVTDPNERQWGMFGHLSALSGFIVPFGNLIGPLIIWQMKKDQHPFAADQAKEALNFNISITILAVISGALICVFVGIILLPLVAVFGLVMTIIAGIAANKGEWYRYPFTIRLIK